MFEKEAKHNLMMKLKDEGIVKPLKDSILRNKRLSNCTSRTKVGGIK